MFDSKLLEIVRAMKPAEVAAFRDSPWYHDSRNRKEIPQLFDYVVVDHPACSRAALSKEATHSHLFVGKDYVENRLNHIMSGLLRLLEAFIASHFSNIFHETGYWYALARFYQDRDLPNRFDSAANHIRAILDTATTPEDENMMWQRFRLEYLVHLQRGLYHQRSSDLNLLPLLDNLERFYIAQRLIISAALLAQNDVVQVDTSRLMLIYDLVSRQENFAHYKDGSPLIRAYYQLLPLLTDEAGLAEVADFRNMLQHSRDVLPPASLKILYTFIRNYLTRGYNRGNSDMLPMLFDNMKDEYEQGFLCEVNGLYRASTFQNVVTVALKLKHFDWTCQFMDVCRGRITGAADPESVMTFNEANYFFHTGDYEAALGTGFHMLKFDNFIYSLAARRLEIMIWYERTDFEMAEFRLNALKSFLFSNKTLMPEQMKKNNDDFVDVMRQILSPRNRKDPKRMVVLAEKVRQERKNIAEREWLLEKL
jgi:hypothetical protein